MIGIGIKMQVSVPGATGDDDDLRLLRGDPLDLVGGGFLEITRPPDLRLGLAGGGYLALVDGWNLLEQV